MPADDIGPDDLITVLQIENERLRDRLRTIEKAAGDVLGEVATEGSTPARDRLCALLLDRSLHA